MESMAAWREKLQYVCSRFSNSSFYVGTLIPADKLNNAKRLYPLPNKGKVIALIDCTLFGSAKEGLLIGDTGLSWSMNWIVINKGVSSITWEQLKHCEIFQFSKQEICIGQSNGFNASGSNFRIDDITTLLKLLQKEWIQHTSKAVTENNVPPHAKREDSVFHYHQPEEKAPDDTGYQKSIEGNWPLINLHTANLDALITLPGVGIAEAEILLQHRRNGHYPKSLAEFIELLHIKPHLMSQLRERTIIPLLKSNSNSEISEPTIDRNSEKPKSNEEPKPRHRTGYRIID